MFTFYFTPGVKIDVDVVTRKALDLVCEQINGDWLKLCRELNIQINHNFRRKCRYLFTSSEEKIRKALYKVNNKILWVDLEQALCAINRPDVISMIEKEKTITMSKY